MNEPDVLSITYDMQYFINLSKEECVKKYKYNEMDVECAYGNINQIFSTIFDCIDHHTDWYSSIAKCTLYTKGNKNSMRKKIVIESGFALVRVLHSHELYTDFCSKFPKYEDNYYPAINLIDILVLATSSLIDKHESINDVIIREEKEDFQFGISFNAERSKENAELIEYTLSIGKETMKKVYI